MNKGDLTQEIAFFSRGVVFVITKSLGVYTHTDTSSSVSAIKCSFVLDHCSWRFERFSNSLC